MRRAARRDYSEKTIVDAMKRLGWVWQPVSIPDGPDGFASRRGRTVAIECKTGTRTLRAGQAEWMAKWQGETRVLRSLDDVLALSIR